MVAPSRPQPSAPPRHPLPPPPDLSDGTDPGPSALTGRVGHYENFPVASVLCPPALRPAVVALYHFARTADDIADEGDDGAAVRLEALARYRAALDAALQGQGSSCPHAWPEVFGPLAEAVRRHTLPAAPLHHLLDAFEQDVRHTAQGLGYADLDGLLAYCARSANPVGRLLLHLHGRHDDLDLDQSDRICSALQLINFWQDLGRDLPRRRDYLPADLLAEQGLDWEDFRALAERPGADPAREQRAAEVVRRLCAHSRALMQEGAPLARRLPGRFGWELRLVVQGGLRILDKIDALDHRTWARRPKLGPTDLPTLVWRALRQA